MTAAPPRDAFAALVLHRAPQRARVGLTLGFVRTFAVPEIAEVLAGTGRLTSAPKARAKATGAMMFALIGHGVDSEPGRAIVAELAAMHRLPGVDAELMRYVLACFTVCPVGFTARNGGVTPAEREAAYAFQAELAAALGLPALPGPDLAGIAAWMREFETARFAPSLAGQALWRAVSGLFAARLPGPLARHAPAFAAALLDAPLRAAFDVPRPAWPLRAAAAAAFRLSR
ncbi:oxygenase MpaB family protein [Kitasatospora griseola]|uniref:oxygenase MpaB family protein n=1 Tax=Kitasatospora griseola TaxID=2064 RepID=UPI000695E8A5|nr:oxygenase MpaB family protein [Kitasatospora griseola]